MASQIPNYQLSLKPTLIFSITISTNSQFRLCSISSF